MGTADQMPDDALGHGNHELERLLLHADVGVFSPKRCCAGRGRGGRASGRTVLLSEIGPATCLSLEMGETPG